MTRDEDKMVLLLREWSALDELVQAQAASVANTIKARESKWAELLYETRKRPEVLR